MRHLLKMLCIIFLLLVTVKFIHTLTCDEVLALPSNKKLSLDELNTILPKDIVKCVGHLGREKLSSTEADFLWQIIKSYYKGVASIPDKVLMALHWVTPAVRPEEYSNITFNDTDVIQNFGLAYDLTKEQLSSIADRVRVDFVGKGFADYTYYDLSALGQILCAFNRSEIEMIHPKAYKESARLIGKLKNCTEDILAGFATLATQPKAFGSPEFWTNEEKEIIGKVSKYLPEQYQEFWSN